MGRNPVVLRVCPTLFVNFLLCVFILFVNLLWHRKDITVFRLESHFLVDLRLLAIGYAGVLHKLVLVTEVEVMLGESGVHVLEDPLNIVSRIA